MRLQILIIFIFLPSFSFAYIDPGSGSAIMAALMGIFVSAGLFFKGIWYKLKSFFSSKKNSKS